MVVDSRRGRRPGQDSRLNAKQVRRLQRLITNKLPKQLKLAFALWAQQAVADLIPQEYGIKLSIHTMGYYL